MQIIWHGQSCFEIITTPARNGYSVAGGPVKNGQVKIIIDPYSEEIGLRMPKLEADILMVSNWHSDHNNIKAVQKNPFLIDGPGEYEINNVFVQGIRSRHNISQEKGKKESARNASYNDAGGNTIYTIVSEEMRLCHLGDLGQKELTEEQLEKIGEIDILMIPVGGVYTISGKEAPKIMSQIEPKITLPMHYHIPKLKIKLDGLDKFLKPLGIKSVETINKLTIKKKGIPTEEAKIIVLKP